MPGPESYRRWINPRGLVPTRIRIDESDLFILAPVDVSRQAEELVRQARCQLRTYIENFPEFASSHIPLDRDPDAPEIAQMMLEAGIGAGVGPMAAVAGAISEFVGKRLERSSTDVIVENGGDIYIRTTVRRHVAIYAGNSPLSGSIGLAVDPGIWGVCTSSGTFGHSFSYGRADASTCLSRSAALSDAAATAVGNAVTCSDDIEEALEIAASIDGIEGALVIVGESLGAWGRIELLDIEKQNPDFL